MWMLFLLAATDWSAVEQNLVRGEYAAARTELARLPKGTPRWHVLASKAADGLHDPATAVSEAETALQLDPRSEAAHVQLGSIFLSHNTLDAALDVFTDAEAALPDSVLIRLGRGLTLKELQRWDEAEAELARCLPNPLAFDALGTILIHLGRFPEAAQLAERFLRAAPNDYRAWYFSAAAKDGQLLPGVDADARRSIQLRPQFAAAHALLGKWLMKNDRAEEAARELEQAVRLRPDLVQAHFQLAQTYQQLGREADAAREFATVRELKEKEKAPRQRLLYHRGASSAK